MIMLYQILIFQFDPSILYNTDIFFFTLSLSIYLSISISISPYLIFSKTLLLCLHFFLSIFYFFLEEPLKILRDIACQHEKRAVYDRTQSQLLLRSPSTSVTVKIPLLQSVQKSEVAFGAQKSMYQNANKMLLLKDLSPKNAIKTSMRHSIILSRIEQNMRKVKSMIHVMPPPSFDDMLLFQNESDGKIHSPDILISNILISNILISNTLISYNLISNTLISNILIFNILISYILISNNLIFNFLISNILISNILISNILISNILISNNLISNILIFNILIFNILISNILISNILISNILISNILISNILIFNILIFNILIFNILISNILIPNNLISTT